MPNSFKAAPSTSACAVFTAAGAPLENATVGTPTPRAGEVLVRVSCCTVCGSDLHTYQGHRDTPVPTILGHEIIGRIEAIGGTLLDLEGNRLELGDRITWSVAASCGECFYCTHELPQKCERLFKYGHEKLRPAHALSGGLAEHCLLAPGTAIVKLPAELPDLVACPINCATSTVAAALRKGQLQAGETVVILGLGALGLTAAAMARSMGAAHVVGCDVDDRRLEVAKSFGVTAGLNVTTGAASLVERVRDLTSGRGADLAIELSGAASSVELGLGSLRIGGRYVLVGSVSRSRDVAINPEVIVRRMLTIHGVHNYAPIDLLAAVRFLTLNHTRYPFEKLIGGTWALANAEAAFKHAIANRSLRVAVRPEEPAPRIEVLVSRAEKVATARRGTVATPAQP